MRSTDVIALSDKLDEFANFALRRSAHLGDANDYAAVTAGRERDRLLEYAKHLADEEAEQDTVPAAEVRKAVGTLTNLVTMLTAESNRKWRADNPVWLRSDGAAAAYDHAREVVERLLEETL
jgi:hypothetical protein